MQETSGPPLLDRAVVYAELGCVLRRRQPAGLAQALFEALEAVGVTYPADAGGGESCIGAGLEAALIEEAGDLAVGMLFKESRDLLDDGVREDWWKSHQGAEPEREVGGARRVVSSIDTGSSGHAVVRSPSRYLAREASINAVGCGSVSS